jgi:hypothetical protein
MRRPSALLILSTECSGVNAQAPRCFLDGEAELQYVKVRAARRDRNGEGMSGGMAFGPPCANDSRPHREGQVLLPLYPNKSGERAVCKPVSARRSPSTFLRTGDRGQGSRKMPGSQPGHHAHGGFVWLSLGNDDVFSNRWNDGLRRRMRGGGRSHPRTRLRNSYPWQHGKYQAIRSKRRVQLPAW